MARSARKSYGFACQRVARTCDDLRLLHLVEEIENLHMREVGDALKRFRRELIRESTASSFLSPKIILGLQASRLHEANRANLLDYRSASE